MHLHRRVKIQLVVLTVIALVALTVMSLHFVKLPAMLFGVGRYTVRMELPQSGGLYQTGNVTYRGTEVGRVQSVHLTNGGVEAVLSLKSASTSRETSKPRCTVSRRSANRTSSCCPATAPRHRSRTAT